MSEVTQFANAPEYKSTMEKLKAAGRVTPAGRDYWLAREIAPILGYQTWERFDDAITRAMSTCAGIGINAHDHFHSTAKKVKLGSGAQREVADYFLSRSACYLVAMNGDPTKPEIAAAQAYFTVQTRRMEIRDETSEDERRLELREKISASFKKVSGVAKDAGVRNSSQASFHDARYQGLYDRPYRDVLAKKGLTPNDRLFDRAGALELSANDFQMNLAADVIAREGIKREGLAITRNRQVGKRVREVIADAGGTMPEDLPLAPPITEVKKRLASRKRLPK
jgi:DNA-damage-inducible protein D